MSASTSAIAFSREEQRLLLERGFAVFEDRVIFDAQPPIDSATIERLESRLAGPLPQGLLALWRVAFGGRLDYDLRARIGGQIARVSFVELFYPESDAYHDLWGWIDHESELAEEAARSAGESWSGRIEYLPFGGFEYLDRLYVDVVPGENHGSVIAWMQGLPPAWKLRLHDDSAAKIADDVPSLFRQLILERNPKMVSEDAIETGADCLQAIGELAEAGAGRDLVQRLETVYLSSVLDWQHALERGELGDDRVRQRALEESVRANDIASLARMRALGFDMSERLSGGGSALDHAMVAHAHDAARQLLAWGIFSQQALTNGPCAPIDIARRLVELGADTTPEAAVLAAEGGQLETAKLIAEQVVSRISSATSEMHALARDEAADRRERAKQIESGALGSNITPEELEERARRLLEFAGWVKSA